ncbi:putative spermidine/putrescine transport system permease protein [Actinoplanes lutulentus]|uniref:Putative spermidine/putrescine transport system permease protein n=1 Tax=Actinoplanes lutulentus TaxID=1287878 RepID=A0A327ZKQ6_9ACTN|nr:ABC transporter permease [Actinoplanes lutulentus]MBB2943911.1 putative spermidine/putrescine transport system permease protein [Actinoplanes lutulentus]RAK42855.1 putative spermidine/putrescine transport system permease protein [Actinoplanes lutulentus]
MAKRPRLRGAALLGTVPFFAYVAIFLIIPTLVVVIGAFASDDGGFTLSNVRSLGDAYIVEAFGRSIALSAMSALIGAALGAVLAYALVTARPDGILRRVVTSAAGVLAQFGGVTLAFAFLATIGLSGFLTLWLSDHGIDLYGNGVWLFELPGLTLVYTYFQIPLMVIVFLPALDGIRPQWREAAESLGSSTWQYWTRVAGPLLAPAFLGSALLLFANAFSAYATAAALVSQGSPIVPLQIRGALTSEVVLGQANLGKAMALGMVIVVAVVMTLYALLQKRTAKWLG